MKFALERWNQREAGAFFFFCYAYTKGTGDDVYCPSHSLSLICFVLILLSRMTGSLEARGACALPLLIAETNYGERKRPREEIEKKKIHLFLIKKW